MTTASTAEAIQLMSEILQCPEGSLNAADTIETVEKWDSLNHMRLVLAIEEKYQVKLEADTALSLFTIEGIADLLETLH
ncbi:acyl carrier protein [Sneathiella limimaris]|uniref:acyl carrier protein n=1 Tax=Sneathiella limimaris TaxID=1964213 RepID=UPI00146CB480|nr:acyl carrier protein [Sneathiella limimaris]